MSGNLFVGPGITIESGITILFLEFVPEVDLSGDLMLLTGQYDLQVETGAIEDLNS